MYLFKDHTQDLLGHVVSRDFAGLTVANFVYSCDPELVFYVVHQTRDQEFSGLELLWDVALVPIFSI